MHKFKINFRKSASDRAAEVSSRAYNHYLRIKPFIGKIWKPVKEHTNKLRIKFYK